MKSSKIRKLGRRSLISLGLLAVFTAPSFTHAEDRAEPLFGTPIHDGNGCPQGSPALITIQGEQIMVEAPFGVSNTQQSFCGVSIPVSLPSGYRLEFSNAYLEGDSQILVGAKAEAHLETFMAGEEGEKLSSVAQSGSAPFRVVGSATQHSRCVGGGILRLQASGQTRVNGTFGAFGSLIVRKFGVSTRAVPCKL